MPPPPELVSCEAPRPARAGDRPGKQNDPQQELGVERRSVSQD